MVEKALLVGIYQDRDKADEAIALLDELEELVTTLGVNIGEKMLVKIRETNKRFICGTGKAQEIIDLAKAHECDVIVFDNMLAPMQQRNYEELGNVCVIDREEVILDIFSNRAQTREAQLQVELARMQYALPRMARMWGHLDREGGSAGASGGGGGASRGMGEKQIEIDRRLARTRISRMKRELESVREQRKTQRKARENQAVPHAAIVGYTNAGKSTLLNKLSGADVLSKDMLFATLDTTTRSIELPDGQPLLLTDTVGFVRNLPHRLVEAFKATLEEAVLADFLIHVLDGSAEEIEAFHATTLEVLEELGAGEKTIITVLNKCDQITDPARYAMLEERFPDSLFVSAFTGEGLDILQEKCTAQLADRVLKQVYTIPQSRGDLMNLLYQDGKVLATDYEGNDIVVTAIVPKSVDGRLSEFLKDKPEMVKKSWEKDV